MKTITTENELQMVVVTSGVEQSTSEMLQEKFMPFYEQALEWKTKAEALVVTNESQKSEMKMAGVARKALKEIRINADKTRKDLKEDSLKYGKAVQSVYNLIEGLIKPIELHLEQQEKFVEIQEENRLMARLAERTEKLKDYAEFVALNLEVKYLSDAEFDTELQRAKERKEFDAKVKAEEEKQRREQELKAEQERQAQIAENARLRKEAEQRQKEHEAQLQKEREEKAKLEQQLQAKKSEEKKIVEANKTVNPKTLSAEERTEIAVSAVNDALDKIKLVLADYLVDDDNLLNEVDVIGARLAGEIEELNVEEDFDYLFGKIKELKNSNIDFDALVDFVVKEDMVAEFVQQIPAKEVDTVIGALDLREYVVVKTPNLAVKMKLEEFVNTEVYPNHIDQKACVFS